MVCHDGNGHNNIIFSLLRSPGINFSTSHNKNVQLDGYIYKERETKSLICDFYLFIYYYYKV